MAGEMAFYFILVITLKWAVLPPTEAEYAVSGWCPTSFVANLSPMGEVPSLSIFLSLFYDVV